MPHGTGAIGRSRAALAPLVLTLDLNSASVLHLVESNASGCAFDAVDDLGEWRSERARGAARPSGRAALRRVALPSQDGSAPKRTQGVSGRPSLYRYAGG